MTADFPDLKTGGDIRGSSSRQWNNLFGEVASVRDLAVGEGLEKVQTDNSLQINLSTPVGGQRRTKARVAVTRLDTSASGRIWVRDVVYATNPPKDGDFAWFGIERQAFPDVGHTQAEFEDITETGATPSETTTVLDAELRGSFWFVGIAGGSTGTIIKQFTFLQFDAPDTFLARPANPGGEDGSGAFDVRIALPYELMETPYHDQTFNSRHYTYFSPDVRRVRLGGGGIDETQLIIPRYQQGQKIEAAKLGHVGMSFTDETSSVPDTEWLDQNISGRAFTQVSPI